jgi:hypothetical protein
MFSRVGQLEKNAPDYPVKPQIMNIEWWEDLISPDQITRENYLTLLSGRRIEGVKPPPPVSLVLSGAYAGENTGVEFPVSKVLDVVRIPDGYEAATVIEYIHYDASTLVAWPRIHSANYYSDDFESPEGERWRSRLTYDVYPISESLKAVAVKGPEDQVFLAFFNVICALTGAAFRQWQIDTYDSVMADYEKRLLDYEEKVAAIASQGGIQIGGNNPLINREIERTELKRSCIDTWLGRILSDDYEEPRWIISDPDGSPPENYPFLDPTNVLSEDRNEVKFFEEAFEWENMTYEFFPYNWASQAKWIELLRIEDPDPVFQEFLRAGVACVRVPVRKERTKSVLYYQKTGIVWSGDENDIGAFDPDDPEGDLYNSYIADIFADDTLDHIDQDVTLDEDTPDTHVVKVPTSLIWLQQDTYLLPDLESEG